MGALSVPRVSVEEYLAAEREAEFRSEYIDGEVSPLTEASTHHAFLLANLAYSFLERLRGGPCRVAVATSRVMLGPRRFVYPDVVVFGEEPVPAAEDDETITNPKVVVEVASRSTAAYDYGLKFAMYRKVPSIAEYVVVSQTEHRIDLFRRGQDETWTLAPFEGAEAACRIDCLGVTIPLSEIYSGVL